MGGDLQDRLYTELPMIEQKSGFDLLKSAKISETPWNYSKPQRLLPNSMNIPSKVAMSWSTACRYFSRPSSLELAAPLIYVCISDFFPLSFTPSLLLLVLFTGSMDLEFRATVKCNHICTSQRRERDSPLDELISAADRSFGSSELKRKR